MNKIWAFLILFSFCSAIFFDARDWFSDSYGNERIFSAQIVDSPTAHGAFVSVVTSEGDTLTAQNKMLFGMEEWLFQAPFPDSPEWRNRNKIHKNEFPALKTSKVEFSGQSVTFTLVPVRWVKIRAITDAAFDMAKTAVTLSIGLIGAMALWLGLMRIAEMSGLLGHMTRVVQPLMRRLFPDIPENHPAFGAITMNLAANVLGLGNAATPLGIKAMEELQKLNNGSETASRAMCMFLAINTSSVQLLPPVTLVALMGSGVAPLMISITLATFFSTIAAVSAAWFFGRKEPAHG
jgi:spore maturation protein A